MTDDEIEKRFLADLEKATALSLETAALEQYKQRRSNNYSAYESSSSINRSFSNYGKKVGWVD